MKIKTLFTMVLVLMLSLVLAVGIFATEANLLAEKPSTDPLYTGWVVNGRDGHTGTEDGCTGDFTTHTPTNIKWEVYADGSGYALYLSIDNEGYLAAYPDGSYNGNTIVYAYTYQNSSNTHGHGWSGTGNGKHSWSGTTGIAVNKFTKLVIGDGITQLNDGAFCGMYGLKVAELPTSLNTLSGSPFKGCAALSMIYTRGQTPEEGVFNLTNIKRHYPTNYYFSACAAVKEYRFAEDATISTLAWGAFRDNTLLESFVSPSGADKVQNDCFDCCTNLKSVVIPATAKSVAQNAFGKCTSLEKVTFLGDTSISYDSSATDKAGVIADVSVNTFKLCTSLSTIKAPAGTKAAEFALKFGFTTLEDSKPEGDALYTGWVINGDDGHNNTSAKSCTAGFDAHAKTNVKWEIYNEGTEEAPSYALYFSIDDEAYAKEFPEGNYLGNTVLYGYANYDATETSGTHCYGWSTSAGRNHSWIYYTGLKQSDFKKVVIGDGITGCTWSCFYGMSGITVIEMPNSLVSFTGAVFKNCTNLSSVYTRGQAAAEGVFNLSNIKTITTNNYSFAGCKAVKQYIFADDVKFSSFSWGCFRDSTSLESMVLPEGPTSMNNDCFDGCTSLKSVVIPASLTGSLAYNAFGNCTSLKEVTFKGDAIVRYDSAATNKAGVISEVKTSDDKYYSNTFRNCTALETINAPVGSRMHTFALTFGFKTSHIVELYSDADVLLCVMTYYPDAKKITVESKNSSWWEWTPGNETVKTFVETYMGLAEHVVFTGIFGKIHTRSQYSPYTSTFEGAENLISICFPKDARVLDYSARGYSFSDCTSLTTIYFGDEADMKMGVIDFSGMYCDKDDAPDKLTNGLFNNCTSITEVILPKLNNGMNSKETVDNNPTIYANTFTGCTKLASITVPATYETIENGAFDGCANLKTLNYYAPASLITKDTFGGVHSGLTINVQSYDDVTAINAALAEANVSASSVVALYKQGMSITGYQVRETGYNGLRTIFSFYDNAFGDYELVEAGSIVATAANYAKYAESFNEENSILKYVDGEFVTPANNVVKTAVYSGGKFVNNYVETETGFNFSITVTNFANEAQYKAEVINCGYEVWLTGDGTYYVVFTREETEGYETNSLYKTTIGMLCSGSITLEKSNNPIYNTLMGCGYETFAPRSDVEGFLFEDPLAEGKFVAAYITESDEEIVLDEAGLGEYFAKVSRTVFGKNVVLSLPEIDDYWAEHINEQLATIPEGRSFIAITDTHYPSNAGKSADLMEYVRRMTGIKKVINLGDPYHDGNTHDIALSNLELSMETKFFDCFGEDGMYAIGNHDSNLTKARSSGDSDSNTYQMDLLLSDKEIYDLTFAHIEEGGNKNKNIVYDEALLAIIEANKAEITEFVLDNVAAENAAEFNNMFGDVSYTAEEMYENLVCWAKMHYAYYDHDSKICYIVLNTGGLTVTDFAILNRELWKFHPSQYEFLNTMLNEISAKYSDYDVIVAGHMFYDRSVANETYNKSLFQMLSAFEGGTSVSFSASGNNAFSGKLFGCTNGASSRTLSYDFSGRSFTGEVICITGHRHIDLDLVSQTKDGQYYTSVAYDSVKDNLSDNAVQLILLNQDNYNESKSAEEAASETMVKGTITEHCFTIFTLTDDNTLVATRIGANDGNKQKTYKLGGYDEGNTFTVADTYMASKPLSTYPKTLEAVIKIPESYTGRGGVVFGNYGMSSHFNFEIYSNGQPRFYICGKSYVFDQVDIRSNDYVHLAITIDNINTTASTADLNCYVNGVLKQTIEDAAIVDSFLVTDLVLGGDAREGNAQYFKGTMKYAAAYSYARTATQIAADCVDFGGDDPMFFYDLTGRKSDVVKDKSGNFYDLTKRIEWLTEEPVLMNYAYSMAVVGDTQKVSIDNPENFHYIYDYILDNVDEKNIKFVIGLGDITDTNAVTEWENAASEIKRMDGVVPYSLVKGNHDGSDNLNTYFPYETYKSVIAGAYEEGSMVNVYHTFSVGSIKYLVLCLDYGAKDEVLEWAGDVIEAHSDYNVIVTTHCYLFRDGTTLDSGDVCPPSSSGEQYNDGDEMWEKLIKNHENIVLVLSGHDPSKSIVHSKATGVNGNTVTQILIDSQGVDKTYSEDGGLGNVAIFHFSEDGKTVQVTYYSTIQNKYYLNTNQFTFELDVVR